MCLPISWPVALVGFFLTVNAIDFGELVRGGNKGETPMSVQPEK